MPAAAQEKITLRLAESLPAGHVIHELVAKPFMELVTKRPMDSDVPALSRGAAWQGQGHGATHRRRCRAIISYIVPSYSSDKYPLTAVAELPGLFDTDCQGSLASTRSRTMAEFSRPGNLDQPSCGRS